MNTPLILEYDETAKNEIADYKKHLEELKAGKIYEEEWQKRRLWQGIYGQRQPDVQMIRIKFPYGLGTTKQFREVANQARTLTNSVVHITTRGALQLHFLPRDETVGLIDDLAKCGLTSREACGNVVRNVSASPYCGITPDQEFDIYPVAQKVFTHCLRNPYSQNFPRKFKISFSGCETRDQGLSYMHDIGYVAQKVNNQYTFNTYAGGGLGGRPVGADLIHKNLPLEHILINATAIMRIFNEFGNRKNRNKARMKFIKLEWGLEKFIEEYQKEFNRILASEYGKSLILNVADYDLDLPTEKADKSKLEALIEDKVWLNKCVFSQNTKDTFGINIRIHRGDLSSDEVDKLADLADKYGQEEIRTAVTQDLIIPYIKLDDVAKVYTVLKEMNLIDSRFHHISNVVACPGRSTCNLSVTSSKGLAAELIKMFEENPELAEGGEKANINISGCHNGCGQHSIGTFGFNGSSRVVNGKAVPCAIISVGGSASNGIRNMGKRLGRVAAKKAPDAIKVLLNYYQENKQNGQSVREYFMEADLSELKPLIKPFDQIGSYEEEKDVYFDYEMPKGEEYTPAVGMGECAGGVLNLVTEAFDDATNYLNMANIVYEKGFAGDVVDNTKNAVRHAMRGALIEAGETLYELEECWQTYEKFFANNDLPQRPKQTLAITNDVSLKEAEEFFKASLEYVKNLRQTYRERKESFTPKNLVDETQASIGIGYRTLDLKGVACPMNYVKAKLALEMMEVGSQLEVLIDSGEPFRNVPNSLQNDGHKIVQLEPLADNEHYSLIIIKDGLKES